MSNDLSEATLRAAQVEDLVQEGLAGLTAEQHENLSKALFPSTHTDKVDVLGKERVLTPIPLKYSREINARLKPFNDKLRSATKGADVDVDEQELANDLLAVSLILAKRYGFEDLAQAITDEEVTTDEIQAFVVTQVNLQQRNDFLLTPLRFLVGLLQQREIMTMSLLSPLQSTNSGQG